MKKKLFIGLSVLTSLIVIGLVSFSVYLSLTVKQLKNLEPKLVDRGELKASIRTPYKFEHEVCHHFFPVKLFSDSPVDKSFEAESNCSVTYNEQQLFLINGNQVYNSNTDFYNSGFMKLAYGEKSPKELMIITYETQTPPQEMMFYKLKHFQDAMIYISGNLSRALSKAKTFEKYVSGDKVIYVWGIPEPGYPENKKVDVLSDEFLITCMGSSCLEYLRDIKLI